MRRIACELIAASLFLGASVTLAEPSDADKARAASLLRQGNAERSIGNVDRALDLYRQAESLKATPLAGLEVARLLEKKGDLVGAVQSLRLAMDLPLDIETFVTTKARKDAQDLLAKVEPREPKLVIAVASKLAGVDITLDGAALPRTQWDTPLELNPGVHTLQLRLNGQLRETRELALVERSNETASFDVEGTLAVRATPGAQCAVDAMPGVVVSAGPTKWLAGTYGITCKAAGFLDKAAVFTVAPGHPTVVDVKLDPEPESGASAPSTAAPCPAPSASAAPNSDAPKPAADAPTPIWRLGVRGGDGAFLATKPDLFTIVGKSATNLSIQALFGIAMMVDVYVVVGNGNIQWLSQVSLGLPGGLYVGANTTSPSAGVFGAFTTGARLITFPDGVSSFIFEPGLMLGTVAATTTHWGPSSVASFKMGVGCTFDRTSELTLQLSFGAIDQITFMVGKSFAL